MSDGKRLEPRPPAFAQLAARHLPANAVIPIGMVALAAASFGWFFYGRGLDVPDEGLLLHVAERLAAGEVPYRDVYFIYTPGLQYVLALLFRLFGPGLGVEHALQFALHLALVLTVYLLTVHLTRWRPIAV